MSLKRLFSIVESPLHPRLTAIYEANSVEEVQFTSMRKALAALKKQKPDYIAAEFFYGYGNNYAGVNISNLDVMLYSLQKYSPDTKVIVFVDKKERCYVDKLNDILPLYAVLQFPVSPDKVANLLR